MGICRGKVTVLPAEGVDGMTIEQQPVRVGDDGFVPFYAAGDSAKGEFHCTECGYGVTIFRELPHCPMCGCTSWEQSTWSPLTHARALAD